MRLNENMQKFLKKDNLIVLILAGILLFVIALPLKDTDKSNTSLTKENNTSPENIASESKVADYKAYDTYLEQKLQYTLSNMAGVGKVEVMITLKASEELVVEKDEPTNRSNTNEEDSEGGKRIVTQLDLGESTVYRTVGSDSEPYVVKTLSPTVEGVVVVAQGAGTGNVNRSIVEIVQALFGVEAHKVMVVKMDADR